MAVNMTAVSLDAVGSKAGGQGIWRSDDLDGSEGRTGVALGQASETDAALSASVRTVFVREVAQAVETDSALVATPVFTGQPIVQALGQAIETDAALGVSSGALEADWLYRVSQPGVIWGHNFATQDEVSAFAWAGGLGGDYDNWNQKNKDALVRVAGEGFSGGGCLRSTMYADDSNYNKPYWWRGFSPFSGAGGGVTGAGATDINGNSADDWGNGSSYNGTGNPGSISANRQGNINHPSEDNANETLAREFYIQFRVRVGAEIDAPGFTGNPDGKLIYLSRTENSLTSQETIIGRPNPGQTTSLSMSGASGGETSPNGRFDWGGDSANSGVSASNTEVKAGTIEQPITQPGNPDWPTTYSHQPGEWITLLVHHRPGQENDPGPGTSQDAVRRAWVVLPGETQYRKWWDYQQYSTDYFNTGAVKGYNAFITTWSNSWSGGSADVITDYDEIILSKDYIPEPGTFNATSQLGQAAADLDEGQWSLDPITWNPQNTQFGISWQNRTGFYDEFRKEIHYMEKAQGGGSARHFIYGEDTDTWRATNLDVLPGQLGHVWSVTFDHQTGNYYCMSDEPTPARSVNYLDRSVEAGQGTANSPWTTYPDASFDLWRQLSGGSNIYSPALGFHPNLLGVNKPGLYGMGVERHSYFDVGNNVWVDTGVPNSSPYRIRTQTQSVYVPGLDILVFGDGEIGDRRYTVIRADDAGNTAPDQYTGPIRIVGLTSNTGKMMIDPRNDSRLMILDSQSGDVWISDDGAQTWELQSFTHPFWTNNPYRAPTEAGGWTCCSIPRYGVVMGMGSHESPGGSMLWRPG